MVKIRPELKSRNDIDTKVTHIFYEVKNLERLILEEDIRRFELAKSIEQEHLMLNYLSEKLLLSQSNLYQSKNDLMVDHICEKIEIDILSLKKYATKKEWESYTTFIFDDSLKRACFLYSIRDSLIWKQRKRDQLGQMLVDLKQIDINHIKKYYTFKLRHFLNNFSRVELNTLVRRIEYTLIEKPIEENLDCFRDLKEKYIQISKRVRDHMFINASIYKLV